jgi:hypothetical protein
MHAIRITYLSAEDMDNLRIVDSRRYQFARRGSFMDREANLCPIKLIPIRRSADFNGRSRADKKTMRRISCRRHDQGVGRRFQEALGKERNARYRSLDPSKPDPERRAVAEYINKSSKHIEWSYFMAGKKRGRPSEI